MGNGFGPSWQEEGKWRFRVWAPSRQKVELHILGPRERLVVLSKIGGGYHQITLNGLAKDTQYLFRLDGKAEYPDPASRFQPQGVHGPSQLPPRCFDWHDHDWKGHPLKDYIIYELHVGTFTQDGTFAGILPHLAYLKELGVTAVALMPVAQFPGERNWGYDGVYPFAVQNSYGGPEGLKKLVNACHQAGLAVILDVVYNHLGPEGNYWPKFSSYFFQKRKNSWGQALNFDGAYSDEVRRFFSENALFWIGEYHIDALRLDAVDAIVDHSATHFLLQLSRAVRKLAGKLNRQIYLFPESDLNDIKILQPEALGGYALDSQWSEDFHRAIYVQISGKTHGPYQDFTGRIQDVAKAFQEGFVLSGQYSSFRKRCHGNSSRDIPAHQFVVYTQNHDIVANHLRGQRFSRCLSYEEQKLTASLLLLSPFIPLLFMGQEYQETAPFHFFSNHSDSRTIDGVRKGRERIFANCSEKDKPPDPQDESAFFLSKLNHRLREEKPHDTLVAFYKELIRLRQENTPFSLRKDNMEVIPYEKENLLTIRRWCGNQECLLVFYFGGRVLLFDLPLKPGKWIRLLDSSETRWSGPGSQAPETLTSEGQVTMELTPKGVLVFHWVRG